MKKIIFTDLDGTFLNHDDYSFEASTEALAQIKKKNIPIIFTTSKTKKEVEILQKKVGIKEPFIIENGAALFIPNRYQNFNLDFLKDFEDKKVLVFGKPYQEIVNFYNQYKDQFGMFGLSDMDEKEICKLTGLSEDDAKYAKKRDFTEPFILEDSTKLQRVENLAATSNIKVTQGGRFFHLIGENQDKGIAVKKTIELFEKLYETKIDSIALGDGENDISMLQVVDTAIIIKNHKDQYLHLELENIQKSTYQGSKGWNEMVLKNV